MAWFLLESNRTFCAIFRRQVQKSCQETAGRLFIEGGVVVITNDMSARLQQFGSGVSRYAAAFLGSNRQTDATKVPGATRIARGIAIASSRIVELVSNDLSVPTPSWTSASSAER
jgi:hypothetical protein